MFVGEVTNFPEKLNILRINLLNINGKHSWPLMPENYCCLIILIFLWIYTSCYNDSVMSFTNAEIIDMHKKSGLFYHNGAYIGVAFVLHVQMCAVIDQKLGTSD